MILSCNFFLYVPTKLREQTSTHEEEKEIYKHFDGSKNYISLFKLILPYKYAVFFVGLLARKRKLPVISETVRDRAKRINLLQNYNF